MQKALADLPVKKLAFGHWPGAVARRWIWTILFLFTFALIGYGELASNSSYTTAALLLGIALLAAGCLYFAGLEDRHYIYSIELIDGNILRCSTIWKFAKVARRVKVFPMKRLGSTWFFMTSLLPPDFCRGLIFPEALE